MERILFENATLLDVNHRNKAGHSVLVEDGRIIAVEAGKIETNTDKIIDVKGKTLMPGLIDAHVHIGIPTMTFAGLAPLPPSYLAIHAAEMGALMLRQGFTTLRDAAGIDHGVIKSITEGLIVGPRIFFAHSLITKTGGHGDTRYQHDEMDSCPCHFNGDAILVADGVPAVRKATREVLRRGASQIKIATSGGVVTEGSSIHAPAFSAAEIRAIVEEATDAETYVMAHAHGHHGIRRAVECGVRTIEHASFLTDELAELMAQHKAYMTPNIFIAKELMDDTSLSDHMRNKAKVVVEAMLASIQLAKKHGVKVGFSSDAFGEPIPRHAEEFLIRAQDEDPYEVIVAATATNAEMMQQQDKLGVIKKDAYADLIIVDGDPVKDISLLADVTGKPIKLVMKDGQIYKNDL